MSDYENWFRSATGGDPYSWQSRLASTAAPDLLEVPTGFGKTEAVLLAWAWRRFGHPDAAVRAGTPRRLVWCLPMRTLVEQTAERASRLLSKLRGDGRIGDVSVHRLMGGAIERGWDERPDGECVLVGTQDQLLSRALMRGYAMSRYRWPVEFAELHSDCQWVLDEVQLMGPGLTTSAQLEAFRRSLGTFGSAQSVWMSATLDPSALDTVDLRSHSLTTFRLLEEERAQPSLAKLWSAAKPLTRFEAPGDDLDAIAGQIAEAHDESTRTLVVLNRVRRAQELFIRLRGKVSGPVQLLHSRFRAGDRVRIQREVLAPEWRGLLIATQVVEAGVDISARVLVTDLAPWPSLVQRFGRCNRRGEFGPGEASVLWINPAALEEDSAAPYEPKDLATARARLLALEDVGPHALDQVSLDPGRPVLPVLRRKDLFELFDTEPDLAGHDIDISRYVRGPGTPDVQVAWRRLEGPPAAETPAATAAELCTVPLGSALVKFMKQAESAWSWDPLEGRWVLTDRNRLVPGRVLLLPVGAGGYDPALGWTGDPKHVPEPVEADAAGPEEGEANEPLSLGVGRWIPLAEHALDVERAMVGILHALDAELPREHLTRAARWHDLGKSHPAFQRLLVSSPGDDHPPADGSVWAKSARGRSSRSARCRDESPNAIVPRHELASALAAIEHDQGDLVAYLVAAHHGKVRLRLRSRPGEPEPPDGRAFAFGVWEGDRLPETDLGDGLRVPETELSLELAKAGRGVRGASWLERTLALLEEWGPFRLAYLEALVRVADWRATRLEREAAASFKHSGAQR